MPLCCLHVCLVLRKSAFYLWENTHRLALTKQLISTFVFATVIVHSLFFLTQKFQASSIFCAGLCQTWLETLKTGFLAMRLICHDTYSHMTGSCDKHPTNTTYPFLSVFLFGILQCTTISLRKLMNWSYTRVNTTQ